jgi:hypothetical protein
MIPYPQNGDLYAWDIDGRTVSMRFIIDIDQSTVLVLNGPGHDITKISKLDLWRKDYNFVIDGWRLIARIERREVPRKARQDG